MKQLEVQKPGFRQYLGRALIYFVFAVLFWLPFYYLVHILGFSENISLIAASIGVIPLLLLFVPIFQQLVDRISLFKVAGVEFSFREAIEESIKGPAFEQVSIGIDLDIDQGREMFYDKSSLSEFIITFRKYLPNPSTRLVILI